jgi:hypothetical protein
MGSTGMLLRDPAYVAGINKAKELRQEGIFSEEDFMQEKELLARQSRERLAAAAQTATAQEEFRTHPGAPGWREYTQADGSSYFYHTDTKVVQWEVPQGVPFAAGLCVSWFSRCWARNRFLSGSLPGWTEPKIAERRVGGRLVGKCSVRFFFRFSLCAVFCYAWLLDVE